MITYIYHKDSTLWAFEGPEEPKKYQKGDSLTYNEAAWMVYKERMSTARESALPVVSVPEGAIGKLERKLEAGEPVALPGRWLEKVLQKRWWGTEWHDLPGQTEGREPDGIYRTVCRLLRSDPEKKPLTVTFYSGKLWHSDKPFPEKCHECDNIANKVYQYCEGCVIEHNKSVLDWLSTAYEVQNPEVIPNVSVAAVGLVTGDGSGWVKLSDGDQITLPDGYGIEDFEQYKKITVPEKPSQYAINRKFDRLISSEIKSAMEKPDNSLNPAAPMIDILNHAMKVSDQISKVVEPSESQEEMWAKIIMDARFYTGSPYSLRDITSHLSSQFTITRK